MVIAGKARVDTSTKALVWRLCPREIAVINHEDLDEVTARALAAKNPRVVVNAQASVSGKYPHRGPLLLLEKGIPVLDEVGEEAFVCLQEGREIKIVGNEVFQGGCLVGRGSWLDREKIKLKCQEAQASYTQALQDFIFNTLDHARREIDLVKQGLSCPFPELDFRKRHVLVVARGRDYEEDLHALRVYLRDVKPVLIGVDGGADALLACGYQPDLIFGDMDSVSDRALRSGARLLVHAYPDGRAPGKKRLERLGLEAPALPAPGTSEDVALLLAYERGADLIVAVGTHSHMLDFLAKGRPGMGSTFLVRLKIGPVLVDAKGVSKLYQPRLRTSYLAAFLLAAFLPFLLTCLVFPSYHQLLELFLLRLRLLASF